MPRATSSKVPVHPPPASPMRRYSSVQVAIPARVSAALRGETCRRSYSDLQHPPWITTATGCGPGPSGRRSSPNCSGSLPYAILWSAGGTGCAAISDHSTGARAGSGTGEFMHAARMGLIVARSGRAFRPRVIVFDSGCRLRR